MVLHLRSAIMSLKDSLVNHRPWNTVKNNINTVGTNCLGLLAKYGKNGPVARELKRILDDLKYIWSALQKGARITGKNKTNSKAIEKIDDMEEAINEIGVVLKLEFRESES